MTLASPTISPDGLELIYGRISGQDVTFRRSVRASNRAAFSAGAPIPELDAACQASQRRSADFSADGLRLYLGCYAFEQLAPVLATLRVADRASSGAAFTLRPDTGAMVGPSAAISHDELTLYTSNDYDAARGPARQYTRASVAEPFGAVTDVPGLSAVNMATPDPAPDGLSVVGYLNGGIVVSTRPSLSADFGATAVLFASAASGEVLGAPELSQDCRSLYFIKQVSSTDAATGASSATASILVAKR